ncbi:biofilm PGA synthesis N-glycosyltransferase PgaC [Alicyclobacillus hesperidum]|uniref:Biofilm PGA synthesis N-glycosyltransferase PgaC n=1 Tax=Alicyclobacillus hesperidum TaxID=89784 RepID=A0A1H2RAU5_9BACL|nr:biofilm PGA synthesis N-glycosyltransferase PgaC [Alicyclobacillus hesperidum]
MWVAFSVYLSRPWLHSFSRYVSFPGALFIITGLAYIPGYLNAFQVVSLLLDRQPPLRDEDPKLPVTILIAAWNEERGIVETLRKIACQDYSGKINVLVVDNNSTDGTTETALRCAEEFGLDVKCLLETRPGKNHALNHGLQHVETELVITLDADTLLHPSAIRHLVSRYVSSPNDVCAVAGAVLVRNSRATTLARMQEWDYFLGIASTKRLQGMYRSTLVAQGAFSLYRTDSVREVGGWPDAIGEDIVLTWRFFYQGWTVYFEPLAVAFTDVPVRFKHFARQRSRWARGMIEGLKEVKPWQNPVAFSKFLTGVDLVIPYIDVTYTFCWIPGLVLCMFGKFYIVGPLTLLVLPITLLSNLVLYMYQRRVFKRLNLRIRRNRVGFVTYVLLYQMMMSPISVWGYIQEFFQLRRVWK